MTEENQKRLGYLARARDVIRDALDARFPDDPVRCGIAFDKAMGQVAGLAYQYMLEHVGRTDVCQCQVCKKPLGDGQAHRIWLGPPDALPANAVLCSECYDFMLAALCVATGQANNQQKGN